MNYSQCIDYMCAIIRTIKHYMLNENDNDNVNYFIENYIINDNQYSVFQSLTCVRHKSTCFDNYYEIDWNGTASDDIFIESVNMIKNIIDSKQPLQEPIFKFQEIYTIVAEYLFFINDNDFQKYIIFRPNDDINQSLCSIAYDLKTIDEKRRLEEYLTTKNPNLSKRIGVDILFRLNNPTQDIKNISNV